MDVRGGRDTDSDNAEAGSLKGAVMKTVAFLILLGLACLVHGADERSKAPAAVEARKVFEQQTKWADAEYQQAVAAAAGKRDAALKTARVDYVTKLKGALDTALKLKNLEEANRIDTEAKAVAAEPSGRGGGEDDRRLAELLVRGRWQLDFWNGGTKGRKVLTWTFDADGGLSDQGHPNWRVENGVLEVYRVFNRFRFNAAARRWEAEVNRVVPSDQGTYIFPAD